MDTSHHNLSRRVFLRNASVALGGATLGRVLGAGVGEAAGDEQSVVLSQQPSLTSHKVNSVGTPIEHADDVWDLAFSPDGSKLATACGEGTCKVIENYTSSSRGIAELQRWISPGKRNYNAIWSVDFSKDGETLLAATQDEKTATWDLKNTPPVITELDSGHAALVADATYNRDGDWIASADSGGYVSYYKDNNTKHRLDSLSSSSPHEEVVCVRCSPTDPEVVATASKLYKAEVWSKAISNPSSKSVKPHQTPVSGLAFTPDGRHLVTTTRRSLRGSSANEMLVNVWDVYQNGPALRSLDLNVRCSAYSPVVHPKHSNPVLVAVTDRNAYLWDWRVANGQLWPLSIPVQGFVPATCAISPEVSLTGTTGKTHFLAVGYSNGLVTIWTHDGNMVNPPAFYSAFLAHQEGDLTVVRFNPADAFTFATASTTNEQTSNVKIWKVSEQIETTKWPTPPSLSVRLVDFDGHVYVYGSGQPIQNAVVQLVDFPYCDVTDSSGSYAFYADIEGDDYYNIRADHDNYLNKKKKKWIDPSPSSITVNFFLNSGSDGALTCGS